MSPRLQQFGDQCRLVGADGISLRELIESDRKRAGGQVSWKDILPWFSEVEHCLPHLLT